MGYNPIEVSQAASKAREELEKSGAVGRVATETLKVSANESVPSPFATTADMIGSVCTAEINAYMMKAELERPGNDVVTILAEPEDDNENYDVSPVSIAYTPGYTNGMAIFDKPCLFVNMGKYTNGESVDYREMYRLAVSPLFYVDYANYDTILYVYDTTKDKLGLGVTLEKGWYAANSATLAVTPYDIGTHPLVFFADEFNGGPAFTEDVTKNDYFRIIAPLAKDYRFTVEDGTLGMFLYDEKLLSLTPGEPLMALFCAFGINDGKLTAFRNCTIPYETIHPIDPKFLPGVCLPVVELSTTINVADTNMVETTLVTADGTALQSVYDAKMPCLIRFNIGGEKVAHVFNFAFLGDLPGYETYGAVYAVWLFPIDGVWKATAKLTMGG